MVYSGTTLHISQIYALVLGAVQPYSIYLLMQCAGLQNNKFDVSCIFHMLDDFLTIGSPVFDAERTMDIMAMIFHRLRLPLADHKTVGPVFVLSF